MRWRCSLACLLSLYAMGCGDSESPAAPTNTAGGSGGAGGGSGGTAGRGGAAGQGGTTAARRTWHASGTSTAWDPVGRAPQGA